MATAAAAAAAAAEEEEEEEEGGDGAATPDQQKQLCAVVKKSKRIERTCRERHCMTGQNEPHTNLHREALDGAGPLRCRIFLS